jgi:hypothetical protein
MHQAKASRDGHRGIWTMTHEIDDQLQNQVLSFTRHDFSHVSNEAATFAMYGPCHLVELGEYATLTSQFQEDNTCGQ